MYTQEQITKAFGNLAELYNDKNTYEIAVDGPNQVRTQKDGKINLEKDLITSEDEIMNIITDLFKLVGREFPKDSWGDIRLADGTRIMAISGAISLNGPIFNVVKMPKQTLNWDDLLKFKAITQEGKDMIEQIMKSSNNVILGGTLGSGKMTLANNITSLIPEPHRVVCLERVPQLDLKNPWVVRLQTPENKKDSMLELLKASSFMRADNLVISEIEGREIPLMLDMMRDGHSIFGCMTADSSTDILRRLEFKYVSSEISHTTEQIKELIANSLDYIIFMSNTDKGRRVTEIIEVCGFEDGKYILKPAYRWDKN